MQNEALEKVNEYIIIPRKDRGSKRSKLCWSAFGRLNLNFEYKMPLSFKRKVYQCVLPVLQRMEVNDGNIDQEVAELECFW